MEEQRFVAQGGAVLMILDWFDARLAVAFGKEIALEVVRIFPRTPGADKPARTRKEAQKEMKKLDGLVRRVQAFSQQNRLNLYKKAKLLNVIKWDLRESGLDEELTNETVSLVARFLK